MMRLLRMAAFTASRTTVRLSRLTCRRGRSDSRACPPESISPHRSIDRCARDTSTLTHRPGKQLAAANACYTAPRPPAPCFRAGARGGIRSAPGVWIQQFCIAEGSHGLQQFESLESKQPAMYRQQEQRREQQGCSMFIAVLFVLVLLTNVKPPDQRHNGVRRAISNPSHI